MTQPMRKVALHSVPRSGSTWLGEIFNSSPEVLYRYQPLFSYAFKGQLDPHSSAEEIDRFFREIAESDDEFVLQRAKRETGVLPAFDKTRPECVVYKEVRYHHILENMLAVTDDVKVVGLVRNPLSVINSWLRAPREFRGDLGWKEDEEWRRAPKKNQGRPEEFAGFEKWVETAGLFLDLAAEHPRRFRLVEYGDLLARPLSVVEELFDWVGLHLHPQTKAFLAESRERTVDDPYSVYRGEPTDRAWQEQLDPGIAEAIVRSVAGTRLEPLLGMTNDELEEWIRPHRGARP